MNFKITQFSLIPPFCPKHTNIHANKISKLHTWKWYFNNTNKVPKTKNTVYVSICSGLNFMSCNIVKGWLVSLWKTCKYQPLAPHNEIFFRNRVAAGVINEEEVTVERKGSLCSTLALRSTGHVPTQWPPSTSHQRGRPQWGNCRPRGAKGCPQRPGEAGGSPLQVSGQQGPGQASVSAFWPPGLWDRAAALSPWVCDTLPALRN